MEATVQTILASPLSAPATVQLLANLWQQDVSLIESLTTSVTLPAVPIHALDYFGQCLGLCQTLGVNGYSLQKLTADDSSFVGLEVARDAALGAFSSKYPDDKQRQDKLEPYQDRVNVKKRDALCDYIIARHQDLKFQDLRDIYAFFLLDVEMSGCFRTSRIVCANSSLQLYVQRCLANLEQSEPTLKNIVHAEVDVSLIPADQWDWRKNYRVWQANRKVFLYAHRYLDPDVRDDKTPIFKELEDELLQEKITKDSAEAAYRKYLTQFAELARLRIAGSYYRQDTGTYYFFGRTQQDPPQYHYRMWHCREGIWSPWVPIDLPIESNRVSAIVHLGKLYIFWVSVRSKERSSISGGNSFLFGHDYAFTVSYSFLSENGKWLTPQKLHLPDVQCHDGDTDQSQYFGVACFPKVDLTGNLFICYLGAHNDYNYSSMSINGGIVAYEVAVRGPSTASSCGRLDLFKNELKTNLPITDTLLRPVGSQIICLFGDANSLGLRFAKEPLDEARIDYGVQPFFSDKFPVLDGATSAPELLAPGAADDTDLNFVGSSDGDFVLSVESQQFLIHQPLLIPGIVGPHATFRITTSLADKLGDALFTNGLEAFFSLAPGSATHPPGPQRLTEIPIGIGFSDSAKLVGPLDDPKHLDFNGAYGTYYRELFLHIPFLMFAQLNADGKFAEARWWISRVFDPIASDPPDPKSPKDRNWRYVEFQTLAPESMRQILTNSAAIETYKSDPFNPHAIARLRLSEYQKYAVTMYIRNELDWGDALFAEDSMESLNEATMHYVLAYEILGKRPIKLGPCDKPAAEALTYDQIGPAIDKNSDFLVSLENWSLAGKIAIKAISQAMANATGAGNADIKSAVGTTVQDSPFPAAAAKAATTLLKYHLPSFGQASKERATLTESPTQMGTTKVTPSYFGADVAKQSLLAFCIPADEDFLQYWDRVEDRLFKLRNCMNISGVRRQLALFQPPIDPMALIRAKAAGLSLDDILAQESATLPPYRFSYLIEKAKQFTQTVQGFGSALLGAIERRDAEELTLLRSVHERTILRMTKEIKSKQIDEAQHQLQALVETKTNVQNRINYYQGLLDEGLTGWEVTEQVARHTAAILRIGAHPIHLAATLAYLLPQLGSPWAIVYGGKQYGDAGGNAAADVMNLASIADAVATSASMEATFQRRQQEWRHQQTLAERELFQVEQQLLAADIREQIAERDLELHQTSMDQADELYDFYKSKFTSLGLYNYLATTLNRLYREAYLLAYDMAKLAQQAYQFERDDDSTLFVAEDNWQSDRAGLLAGERLLLQLQRMEQAYVVQNVRDSELTQAFSLALFDPGALVRLRETGSCDFSISEVLLDLFNPGQYRRFIKAVRVTIPCVVGPNASVSATLTLSPGHRVRLDHATTPSYSNDPSQPDPNLLMIRPDPSCMTISVNAQNEGGVFELNFRDERYLPFEGAGLISDWTLELPTKLRMFDYSTISDVILHVNFRAMFDGKLKETVETGIALALIDLGASKGLFRLFSLRHEFPTAYHRLLSPTAAAQSTDFEVTRQHFPYFLAAQKIFAPTAVEITVYLRAQGGKSLDQQTQLSLNGVGVGNPWTLVDAATSSTMQATITNPKGPVVGTWTINTGGNGLDNEVLDDVLILLKYKISQ